MVSNSRKDKESPPEAVEALRFLFQDAIIQIFEGPIHMYLPPVAEHADQIVNMKKPLGTTRIIRNEEVL